MFSTFRTNKTVHIWHMYNKSRTYPFPKPHISFPIQTPLIVKRSRIKTQLTILEVITNRNHQRESCVRFLYNILHSLERDYN